jgi:hypothetical protein
VSELAIGELRFRTGDLFRSEIDRIVRAAHSRIPFAHIKAKLHKYVNVSKGPSALLYLDIGEHGWSSLKYSQ